MVIHRPTFTINNYRNDQEDNRPSWNDNKFHRKGSHSTTDVTTAHDFNTEMVDEMLTVLYNNRHVRIRDLEGHAESTFNHFTSIARCLRGSEGFNTLYAMVREAFKNEAHEAKPGTVLAFLTKCMATTDGNEAVGCSVGCATGLKPPDDQGYRCQHNVVLAGLTTSGYEFKIVQPVESNKAIIYVPNCSNSKNFLGFSEYECGRLRELGLTEIKIRGVNEETETTVEITNGFVACDMVKPRNSDTSSDNNNAILIVVLVILILVIIFVGWRFLSYQNYDY